MKDATKLAGSILAAALALLALAMGTTENNAQRGAQEPTVLERASVVKALSSMSVLEAAGVMSDAGIITGWQWKPPTTGAPVAFYRVRMSFDVADTMFSYWSTAICADESVQVAGVDSLGRMGLWSNPGACE